MNRQKELILAALEYCKKNFKPGTQSVNIELKGFSKDEVGLVYQQLFDDELIKGYDFTSPNDKYKNVNIVALTGLGEMRLIELADEKKSQGFIGWFKKNWFPFLTLLITSGINLYKLISELCK